MAVPETVDLVFKTHLDIGFTDHAEAVRQLYHHQFIPQALNTAEHFWREDPSAPKFVWTTGAWLIHDYLAAATPAKVARLESAIERGLIRWHGLPYTTHTELMTPALLRAGLGYSAELDARFGMTTRAAKMTDVPGHTLGLVPEMARAGLRFLHLGVNSASPVPDVPAIFRWRAPDGTEIVVMYQDSYGETHTPPGMTGALSFAHTHDNLGPQSVGQVIDAWRSLEKAVSGAHIRAASLEGFAALLWDRREDFPVVEVEIGDSWIHGVASDPGKLARFRALERLYDAFDTEGLDPARLAFGRDLCMVAEHTWGVDIKTYLRDETAWDAGPFHTARRSDPRFAFTEASWAEQRGFLDRAVGHLGARDRLRADAVLADCAAPARISTSTDVAEIGGWTVAVDPRTGDLVSMSSADGRRLAGAPATSWRHRSYDAADIDRHMDSYLTDRPDWAYFDHAKPGLAGARTARSELVAPMFEGLASDGQSLEVRATLPRSAVEEIGAPETQRWRITPLSDGLEVALVLEGKRANRMPEAGFWCIEPEGVGGWELLKSGLWIDPARTARRAGGALHAVFGARRGDLQLTPLDSALVAPAGADFMAFHPEPPAWDAGLSIVLYNNKWGTNFPMWWDGSLISRIQVRWEKTEQTIRRGGTAA